MYNIAFTATDVHCKILTFLKASCMKYQVMVKIPNEVISRGFLSSLGK